MKIRIPEAEVVPDVDAPWSDAFLKFRLGERLKTSQIDHSNSSYYLDICCHDNRHYTEMPFTDPLASVGDGERLRFVPLAAATAVLPFRSTSDFDDVDSCDILGDTALETDGFVVFLLSGCDLDGRTLSGRVLGVSA